MADDVSKEKLTNNTFFFVNSQVPCKLCFST